MATSSSSTSVVANPSYKSYKIFINHRGVEVKKTFARSLYLRLREKGLTAFLDDKEMQVGYEISSQLEHVIRTASVHVAILSPGYAESSWCLNELVMMLQSNAPVIPVFYRVSPADVRWMLGFYGEALQSLEKKGRYDTNTTMEWRKALQRVASNSGFGLESSSGEELELELLDKLVKRLSEMVPKPGLHVAHYPTGLDLKLKDFEDTVLLQTEQSRKPQILGIVGLGGVGKTTLAKAFFNRKRSGYDKSCFLADVRDHASKGSLHLLQSQLLNSLNGWDTKVNNVHEGTGMLEEPLGRFKALIVLDDVDNVDQVNAFLPFQTFYGNLNSRSLILITSRDRGVLRNSRVEDSSIYKLSGLNEEHSQELFCFYAFSQADPRPAFQHLVDKFLECCHGLPLSLKIVGALLYNKEISEWEDLLEDLKEILPSDIQKTLFRSYCSLDKQEKEIFLDIACFFIGENRDSAISIWNGSDWRGKRGFLNLQDKSLVEVDDRNCIRMHDHVRDLGREVAATSSPHRLWQTKRVIDYLSQQSFEITVRGIRLVEGEFGGDYLCDIIETENDGWNRILRRLQILHIEGSLLERILTRVELPNLLWLSWQRCPHSSLPSLVTMKKLRVLQVDGSQLKTLLDSECLSSAPLQLPLQLKELYVDAPLSEVSESIGKLNQLERIVLKNGYFKSLPNEFYDMHSLKHITLQNCEQMMLLPDSVGILTGLQILDFSGCSSLEWLPDSVGQLTGLQTLDLSGCSSLKWLPDSVGQLTGLQTLDLNGCSSLQRLPDLFGDLINLQNINLNWCSSLQRLPYSVGKLWNLQSIGLRGCSNLQMIPNYFGNLEGLERIDLSGCSGLHMLPNSFRNLKNLRHLDLSTCSNLEMLPYSFGNLRNLQYINLSKCSNLQMLPNSLENLKQLQYMNLSWCSNFQTLPNSFGNLRNLRHIDLSWCSNLQMLPNSFGNLTNLQHINLSGCSNLPILPNSFGNLIQLKHLYLGKCYELSISNETLGQIRTLEALEISGCYGIEVLPPQITNQQFLREMYLFCPFLRELPSAIGELSHLEILHLESSCLELLEMGELVSLEELQVRECVNLKSIQGLAQMTKLRRLDVANCSSLKELSGVEHLISLEKLNAAGCPNLQWGSGVLEQLDKQLKGSIIK